MEIERFNLRVVVSWNEKTKKAIFRVFGSEKLFGETIDAESPSDFYEKGLDFLKKAETVFKEENEKISAKLKNKNGEK